MNHTIKIKLDANGSITYSDRRLIIKAGDDIEWVCEGGKAFAVHFANLTPLNKVRCRSGSGRNIKKKINNPAHPGVYKYFVAVVDNNDNIWTDDPEIIVDTS
ncbi:MAG: hypothetical protein ACE5JB_09970 [bacterium]